MKIGVNLFSIRNLIQTEDELIKTILLLKKNGCDFVQFSGSPVPLVSLKDVVKKTGVPIVLTHSPYDRIVGDLDNLIKEHKSFGCKNIGLGMLPPKGFTDEKELNIFIKNANKVVKRLEKENMKFFYHNHFQEFKKNKKGETIFDLLIKEIPGLNFTLDTYWVQYGGASILEMIEKLKGRIECVHLKDYKVSEQLAPEFAPLGDGNINLHAVVDKMKKFGTKYFLIEQDNAAEKKDGIKDIIKSIKYLKEEF